MKIGIIEPVGGHGGMDYYDYGLAMGLGKNNVQSILYTCDETNVKNYENVTTKIVFKNVWTPNLFLKVSRYLQGHISSFRDAKKNGAQIIHLHFFSFRFIDFIVLLLGKIFGLKIIVTIHDVNSFHKQSSSSIEKISLRLIDGVILHNKSSYDVLISKGMNLPPLTIIPHGNYLPFINTIRYENSESRPFQLLFFGQIKKVKGLEILLQALAICHQNSLAVHLTIAGKTWKSDLAEYESLIESLGIDTLVTKHFRYIPDQEVEHYFRNADLVVLPYKEIYQSGVALLTMSYGIPVLCSDLQPFKELIKDNETGFLFKSESASDLAAKIMKITGMRTELKRVADRSLSHITENYDWAVVGSKTREFYQRLI